ncbi:MAG TPA: phospholipase C, phosphocholine-specific [Nocardioides sp.]|jgi:phospholipase C|uniref:phosphocholine-specific phospholipase C n=1 Tax=Nocardioides sp. TaxID=35761 RepID=UPI002E2FBD59|nr:phospholipase C, phosphocholine-specific [Nocardioides sp.]HEX3931385.1 phospholipase C, phosphocholine-specific [Nocardioides sp.]
MPEVDRRRFLQIAGGGAAMSVLTPSIARAASIPAARRTGSLADVEHVVVLLQENRSFDHYFGTMSGVRGYGDPHPAVNRNGRSVFHQPSGKKLRDEVLPFRPDLKDLGLAFIQDIDHGWESQHDAFAKGNHDRWVPAKQTPVTMAHLRRQDIPFHYALADAFTVCDAYHCSMLGPTDPNREYLWSGWVGNNGKGGGPMIENVSGPFGWTTYPQRLQKAGVDWKVYQDQGTGLDAANFWGFTGDPFIGNYGDNALLFFKAYQSAVSGDPLYERARTGTDLDDHPNTSFFDQLESDVTGGTLPQVSWVVAPEAFTEHPNWPANYGAWYVSKVLDALTSDPEVWAKTVLFLTYDENDGFFDHQVPPYPSVGALNGDSTVSLAHEHYTGKLGSAGPYGLGIRVPMTVISPWSTGGWVCSETFDHTSVIRFMEQLFGVHEPNITPWRRAVCGDLTSAFDFSATQTAVPSLPVTTAYQPPPDATREPDATGVHPPAKQHLPKQEAGSRPARALGYRLQVDLVVKKDELRFTLDNLGSLGAHLQARSNDVAGAPYSYTLGAGHSLRPVLKTRGRFDVSFHGPNGFFRRFAGSTREPLLEVHGRRHDGKLVLRLHNRSEHRLEVKVADAYAGARTVRVRAGAVREVRIGLTASRGWYDVLVTVPQHPHLVRALAGRFEDGRPGVTDPQLSR